MKISARSTSGRPAVRRVTREWFIRIVIGLAVAAAGLLLGLQLSNTTDQRDATADRAVAAAVPVTQLCSEGGTTAQDLQERGACGQAQSIVADPIAGPVGPAGIPGLPGADGDPGADGRGIRSTAVSGTGHLLITYTDGSVTDVGVVTGPQGVPGAAGTTGRGITSTSIVGGRLSVTYTDGTVTDVGPVVGAAGMNGQAGLDGRGISSVAQVDGRLMITFTDGSTQDAGPLPAGPPGATGQPGPEVFTCPAGETPQTVTYGGLAGPTGTACVAS